MKNIFPLLLAATFFSTPVWHHDLSEARQLAVSEHRHILLNFSGSDWCGPCMRMRKEVFESEVFMNFADSELVMVNADFPRMKKNQLPARQQALNDAMAEQYDAKGKFPFTVL
ncbi:MAG: thioredoxin family protein, partial [Bacteroidota bacterium]|nr:thioredoxin family protein [Bacteroidota bacterium]